MSDGVVFFIGAGASAAMGLPVTKQILPAIIERARAKSLFDPSFGGVVSLEDDEKPEWIFDESDCAALMAFAELLMIGLPASSPDQFRKPGAVSIIDVLSLLDLMLLTDAAPMAEYGVDRVRQCRKMLECGLFNVVRPGEAMTPEHADLRAKLLDRMREMSGRHVLNIVSTNYDTLLEQAIFDAIQGANPSEGGAGVAHRVDLGMRWRDVLSGDVYGMPKDPEWRVLKLHGSMNWLRCSLCGYVYVNPTGTIQHQAFRKAVDSYNSCHCRHGRLEPVMVTPSLVRDTREGNLLSVWQASLEALRTASVWVFIGYSLPAEDIAIRSMLLRAFHGRGWAPQPPAIHVVELGDEARARYEMFFGPSITYSPDGLAGWLARPAP